MRYTYTGRPGPELASTGTLNEETRLALLALVQATNIEALALLTDLAAIMMARGEQVPSDVNDAIRALLAEIRKFDKGIFDPLQSTDTPPQA